MPVWVEHVASDLAVQHASVDRVVDSVGVALAGRNAGNVAIARSVDAFGNGPCTVWGDRSASSSAAGAALTNGIAAHSLEYDDYSEVVAIHPGAVIVPSCLAFAEARSLPGSAVLRGVAVGYEVFERVGRLAERGSMHARGFHTTSVIGPVAAAAACLAASDPHDHGALINAMGLAASTSGGVLAFLDGGGWSKRFHPGWAAAGGVVAAQLGAAGYGGPASAIDGRFGIIAGFGSPLNVDADETANVLRDLPQAGWTVETCGYKMSACCGFLNSAVTAVLDLRAQLTADGGLDEIDRVKIGLPDAVFPVVVEPEEAKRAPRDSAEAQFSVFHCVAAALLDGEAGATQFTDAASARSDLAALRRRIVVQRDDELSGRYPEKYGARVTVERSNGRRYETVCLDPFGSAGRPPSSDDLDRKFLLGAEAAGLDDDDAQMLLARLRSLASASDTRTVLAPG